MQLLEDFLTLDLGWAVFKTICFSSFSSNIGFTSFLRRDKSLISKSHVAMINFSLLAFVLVIISLIEDNIDSIYST